MIQKVKTARCYFVLLIFARELTTNSIVKIRFFLEVFFSTSFFMYVCVIFKRLRRPLGFFKLFVRNIVLTIAKTMKCGSFGSYGGSGNSAIFLLTDCFISQQASVAWLRMVIPGAEFCGATLYNV